MESPFSKEVDILGTKYTIEMKGRDEDDGFKERHAHAYGYMDSINKRIVIKDETKRKDWEEKDTETFVKWAKKTLRHEIVHAFLCESGLMHNTKYSGNWSDNEEMVDWIAIQGEKLALAWAQAGAMS